MAKYELTIYGENDEIIKKHETNDVKWGVYLEAAKIYDEIESMTEAEQIEIVNSFVKRMFIGLTDDELNCAYGDDVMGVFNQLMKKAKAIGGAKNPQAAGK